MSISNSAEYLIAWLPSGITIALVFLALFLLQKLLEKYFTRSGFHFRNHAVLLIVFLIGLVAIIFSFPIADTARGQILAFLGVLLSAALALSSTTLLGNLLAGLMLRVVKNYRPGDYILIGETFGRVTEMGLLHTEIQTQYRDLTTLPNFFLASHPVTVIQSSGTIVSAKISLGYDTHYLHVRSLLKAAADDAGLRESYVHVIELGDYSITYRAAGLLEPVKNLLTVRSLLREKMLDYLHEAGIEIVSPSYMNQRQLPPDSRTIPVKFHHDGHEKTLPIPEKIAFDKAEEAESIETLKKRVEELEKEEDAIKKQLSDATGEPERERIARDLKSREQLRDRLQIRILALSEKQKGRD